MDRYQELAELQRNWTPPAELRSLENREVRLSGRGIALAALAGILILGGVGVGIGLERTGMQQTADQLQLTEQGRDVEATVASLWKTTGKEHQPMVTYQFHAEGRTYRRSVAVPSGIWKKLTAGTVLVVRYLPADPTHSHPRDWQASQLPLWVALLVGFFVSATGVLFVYIIRRQLALLREGRAAPGVVTRHSYAGKGQRKYHYEFAIPGGALEKGKSGPTRKLPAIGAKVCVIYDPDNPPRNSPYPFEIAKIANEEDRTKN